MFVVSRRVVAVCVVAVATTDVIAVAAGVVLAFKFAMPVSVRVFVVGVV